MKWITVHEGEHSFRVETRTDIAEVPGGILVRTMRYKYSGDGPCASEALVFIPTTTPHEWLAMAALT